MKRLPEAPRKELIKYYNWIVIFIIIIKVIIIKITITKVIIIKIMMEPHYLICPQPFSQTTMKQ